ncbi:MAG: hypothetical protein N2555_01355 [Endomicrobia bacterium]|nr:hypothetical protein [Endomicrobiia bacterium]
MKKVFSKIVLSLVILTVSFKFANSTVGLGTKFATIVLEKLEPGGVYNITKLRNLPLVVINSGSTETEVAVDIEIPTKEELKEGYEPILDPEWIKIIPNRFNLKPSESYTCDVIVSVPNDPKLIGRHFQAKIWAHTVGDDLFGAGVVNRLFFSIGAPGPESVQKAKKKELLFSFNFDTEPKDIYLTVPVGKKVDILKEFDKSIKLINKSKSEIVVKLESVENKRGENIIAQVPSQYEFTPNVGFISFKKDTIKVKKNSVQDAGFYITIPDEKIHYEKQYMFIVKIYPIKPEIPVEFYTKVFVTVKK